jgi:hypothetical protein
MPTALNRAHYLRPLLLQNVPNNLTRRKWIFVAFGTLSLITALPLDSYSPKKYLKNFAAPTDMILPQLPEPISPPGLMAQVCPIVKTSINGQPLIGRSATRRTLLFAARRPRSNPASTSTSNLKKSLEKVAVRCWQCQRQKCYRSLQNAGPALQADTVCHYFIALRMRAEKSGTFL